MATSAVLKLGADGALLLSAEAPGAPVVRPALPIPFAVDPVGAGDAFCAGFIAARLDRLQLEHALDQANACGAASAVSLDDQTGLPDRDELAALLAMGAGTPDALR
ncbi:MAG TPA: carbohydrate kinase family protein [Candidatus Limnocylindrales bacterium]